MRAAEFQMTLHCPKVEWIVGIIYRFCPYILCISLYINE